MKRKLLIVLLSVDLLLLPLSWIWKGVPGIYSSQIAFWTSLAVVLASFGSYRRMVAQRIEAGMVASEERDPLEKIEDPYELYDEEETEPSENFREMVKEEKRRMKAQRRSPMKVARDAVPAFSLWRLGAYGLLVLGFFYLQGRGVLSLPVYLLSLALPIVLTVWVLLQSGVRDAR